MYEPDSKQVEVILRDLGLGGARAVGTPWSKDDWSQPEGHIHLHKRRVEAAGEQDARLRVQEEPGRVLHYNKLEDWMARRSRSMRTTPNCTSRSLLASTICRRTCPG